MKICVFYVYDTSGGGVRLLLIVVCLKSARDCRPVPGLVADKSKRTVSAFVYGGTYRVLCE